MNDVEQVDRGHREEVDLGHPVRSFSLVMVALGVAMLALQWTGALQPRVMVHSSGEGEAQGTYRISVAIENKGGTAARILDAAWPFTGVAQTRLVLGPPGDTGVPSAGAEPFAPFTLDPGDGRVLSLVVVSGCPAEVGELELRVRTALGVTRTVTIEDLGTWDMGFLC